MKCRIGNIVPDCGYRTDGISNIWLLDFEDFVGLGFRGEETYACGRVENIQRGGEFTSLESTDTAKYTSTLQKGVYTHTLESFIGDLSADILSELHLATKRRYVVLFRSKSGRHFIFGYGSGATVNYSSQTSDGFGALVTITSKSRYPLFETSSRVLIPWILEDGKWNGRGAWYEHGKWNF